MPDDKKGWYHVSVSNAKAALVLMFIVGTAWGASQYGIKSNGDKIRDNRTLIIRTQRAMENDRALVLSEIRENRQVLYKLLGKSRK